MPRCALLRLSPLNTYCPSPRLSVPCDLLSDNSTHGCNSWLMVVGWRERGSGSGVEEEEEAGGAPRRAAWLAASNEGGRELGSGRRGGRGRGEGRGRGGKGRKERPQWGRVTDGPHPARAGAGQPLTRTQTSTFLPVAQRAGPPPTLADPQVATSLTASHATSIDAVPVLRAPVISS